MKEALRHLLAEMSTIDAVAGFEREMAIYMRDALAPYADEVSVDRYGNVIAVRRGRSETPSLMLAAHLDEVGLIVKGIEPDGFLRVDPIGRFPDGMFANRRVRVNGHFGVVGLKSGHLQSEAEQARVVPIRDLAIDVGCRSAEEVARLGIRIGDPVAIVGPLEEFSNTDRVAMKAADDRTGCATLIQVFRELADKEIDGTLYGVGTVLEEVGLRGAPMVAYRLNPDYAVALDGQPAADVPGGSLTQDAAVAMGRGPTILLASSTGNYRGSIAHPAVKRALIQAAEHEGVPYQLCTNIRGGSTDAASIHLVREGIPTGTVGVPRRYTYSANEVVDLNDLVGGVRLLRRFVEEMGEHRNLGVI